MNSRKLLFRHACGFTKVRAPQAIKPTQQNQLGFFTAIAGLKKEVLEREFRFFINNRFFPIQVVWV